MKSDISRPEHPAVQVESQRPCLLTDPGSHKCPSGHIVYSYIKKVI